MQTVFSPSIRSSASSLNTQNRHSSAYTATSSNSLLRGALSQDRVEISPQFNGKKAKITYVPHGTTTTGQSCYWLYKDGQLQAHEGAFVSAPVLDGKPGETKMVKISDAEIAANNNQLKPLPPNPH